MLTSSQYCQKYNITQKYFWQLVQRGRITGKKEGRFWLVEDKPYMRLRSNLDLLKVQLRLPPHVEVAARDKAWEAGLPLSTYLTTVLEQQLCRRD